MSKTLYIHENTAIINFNQGFPDRSIDIINSESLQTVITGYLSQASKNKRARIEELCQSDRLDLEIVELARQLHIYAIDDVTHPLIQDVALVKDIIEDIYRYWRDFQRCSLLHLGRRSKSELVNFIDKDGEFNSIILKFYRILQEKVQGRKNKIYRQLKAGTNASIAIREKYPILPAEYDNLKHIQFVDSILLHSPLLLHPKTNKREGHFQETYTNPIAGFEFSRDEFYCYSAKVGTLLAHIYFHRDFIFSGISLANLFELATTEEIESRKPDIIVAFGVKDQSEEMCFYHDQENDIVISKIAYQTKITYFGYMKKIVLTSYNVAVTARKWLPIHGSMINIHLRDKNVFGVVFMGDSGAGKSEIIEEILNLGSNTIDHIDVIFDDMGAFHIKDGHIVAQGTEVGAFVRLDDLDRSSPYQAMDRSIFMNPESAVNARVIIPITDYKLVAGDHPVDYFLYANNYDKRIGVELFDNALDGKDVFIEGKRMSKATTHEVGLTYSFFANPFGPLQQEQICRPLIDHYFERMNETHVQVGQVFTNLGVLDKDETSLKQSAREVLNLLGKTSDTRQ